MLLVSSEWSQRTAQITFSLVPKRMRVLAAKLLAGLVWSLAAFAASLLAATIATAAGGVEGAFELPGALIYQDLLYLLLSVVGGIAFGAALLASAPAIVLYFVLPPRMDDRRLAGLPGGRRALAGQLAHVLPDARGGSEWHAVGARGATVALWILLPLVIGVLRITRGEVR